MQERLLFYGRTAEPYFFYEPIDVAPTQLGVSGKGSHLFLIRPYTWQGRLLTKEFKVKKKKPDWYGLLMDSNFMKSGIKHSHTINPPLFDYWLFLFTKME